MLRVFPFCGSRQAPDHVGDDSDEPLSTTRRGVVSRDRAGIEKGQFGVGESNTVLFIIRSGFSGIPDDPYVCMPYILQPHVKCHIDSMIPGPVVAITAVLFQANRASDSVSVPCLEVPGEQIEGHAGHGRGVCRNRARSPELRSNSADDAIYEGGECLDA